MFLTIISYFQKSCVVESTFLVLFSICIYSEIIVIYATSFCINWAFLIAPGTRLKHERSEDFKASRAIKKAQLGAPILPSRSKG
jgi:hypothetical protein